MRTLITFFCILFLQTTIFGANDNIHPKPQSCKGTGKTVSPDQVQIIGGEQADIDAVRLLRGFFRTTGGTKSYPIYIGEKGDKAVKKHNKLIPSISGGYYLSITPEQAVIAGFDERGTYYAIQTLSQLLKGNRLPEIEITDYPDVLHRGTVEGFYGQPWSHRDRISQLNFYGAHKLNTYIYGPKDDPFHSCPNWRKPYPAEEAQQISELAEVAKTNKVDFVWAIHPGQDIKWNEEDRGLLLNKFQMMYDLGVRSFAVFFDDISGEGTDPNKQAELLNYLHDNFVSRKKDVTPLIVCPTQYNKSWADPKPGSYLDILGDKLYPSIQIMWTGDRVVSDITVEGLNYINARIKRSAYIWWNFPVSDYVRDHLLMGRVYGLDTEAKGMMSGFVSNPMDKPEASKIAIYSIAGYSWNIKNYDSQQEWEDAIRYILPESAIAFRTFAEHNSDLGQNGHGYRREESVDIKPVVDRFTKALEKGKMNGEDLERLKKEFEKIAKTPATLFAFNENPALLAEIKPWLEQFEILGKTGCASINLLHTLQGIDFNEPSVWNQYCYVQHLAAQKEAIDKSFNKNPYQPGVKTSSLVLQPFVEELNKRSAQHLYQHLNQNNGQASSNVVQTKSQLRTNINQLANVQLQTREESVAVTPLLEVVKIAAGQYFAIELPLTIQEGRMEINLNHKEFANWGRVEVSENGTNWTKTELSQKGTNFTTAFNGQAAKMIRIVNAGDSPQEFHLKKCTLYSEQLSGKSGNLLTAIDGDLSTVYRLKGEQVFAKTVSGRPEFVRVLTTPDPQTNLTVFAIDKQNRKYKLDRVTTAFATLDLSDIQEEVVALEIHSKNSIGIHEIIWNIQ